MEIKTNNKLYIGIDVHKRSWSVSIFTDILHHKTFSQPPLPKALQKHRILKPGRWTKSTPLNSRTRRLGPDGLKARRSAREK